MTTKVEKCPTCGGDAVNRSEFLESCIENSDEVNTQLYKIKRAIKQYYLSLDSGEHGGVAESKAFDEIQELLGMSWQRGETKEWLKNHPSFKPFYEVK